MTDIVENEVFHLYTMYNKVITDRGAFISGLENAAKLDAMALDYVFDTITCKFQMPHLASIIKSTTH